jgi:hypothetical protein
MLHSSNPQTSIAIPEQLIGIDFTVTEQSIRTDRGSNRIRLEFVAGDLHEPGAVAGN